MIKCDTLQHGLLDLVFLNAALALIGDASGLQPSAAAGSLYLSLHTADPGEAGNQTTSEIAYTSYARVAVARTGSGWTRTGNTMKNAAQAQFPQSTGGSGVALYLGIGTASSGTGSLLYRIPLGSSLGPFAADDGASNNILIPAHGLSVDDRVAFFATLGGSLPTGVTEGQAYFVKTVTDSDQVIIAATSGGAAIAITGTGGGMAFKVVPVDCAAPAQPTFAADALQISEF